MQVEPQPSMSPLQQAAIAALRSESGIAAWIAGDADWEAKFDPWPEMMDLAAMLDIELPGWRDLAPPGFEISPYAATQTWLCCAPNDTGSFHQSRQLAVSHAWDLLGEIPPAQIEDISNAHRT